MRKRDIIVGSVVIVVWVVVMGLVAVSVYHHEIEGRAVGTAAQLISHMAA